MGTVSTSAFRQIQVDTWADRYIGTLSTLIHRSIVSGQNPLVGAVLMVFLLNVILNEKNENKYNKKL